MSDFQSPIQRHKVFLSSLLACLFFGFMVGCAGPPKHPTWSNATGAEQHERLMWQAMRNKDWTNFERSLAPAFVGIDSTGKSFHRAAWVERWKEAAITDYALGEMEVQPGGPDLVVTYLITLPSRNPANANAVQRLRVVSVWQHVKSRLILISSSMTPSQGD